MITSLTWEVALARHLETGRTKVRRRPHRTGRRAPWNRTHDS